MPRSSLLTPLSESDLSEETIPDSQRSSTYLQILRQKAELDKSIASLRRLARDTMDGTTVFGGTEADDGKLSSASRSEFSLSNFPAPPWRASTDTQFTVRQGVTPQVTIHRAESIKSHRVTATETDADLLPPRMPVAAEHTRNLSIPFSDNDDPLPTGRTRKDSAGTEYVITSFIGRE